MIIILVVLFYLPESFPFQLSVITMAVPAPPTGLLKCHLSPMFFLTPQPKIANLYYEVFWHDVSFLWVCRREVMIPKKTPLHWAKSCIKYFFSKSFNKLPLVEFTTSVNLALHQDKLWMARRCHCYLIRKTLMFC